MLCVLLELNLISVTSPVPYTQDQICDIISNNQTAFDAIYDDPAARKAARDEYLEDAQRVIVVDKREDCG
jgi:hypothetical protein